MRASLCVCVRVYMCLYQCTYVSSAMQTQKFKMIWIHFILHCYSNDLFVYCIRTMANERSSKSKLISLDTPQFVGGVSSLTKWYGACTLHHTARKHTHARTRCPAIITRTGWYHSIYYSIHSYGYGANFSGSHLISVKHQNTFRNQCAELIAFLILKPCYFIQRRSYVDVQRTETGTGLNHPLLDVFTRTGESKRIDSMSKHKIF